MVKKVLTKEVKRFDTNLKIRKAPTKLELEMQVKMLKQANDQTSRKPTDAWTMYAGDFGFLRHILVMMFVRIGWLNANIPGKP